MGLGSVMIGVLFAVIPLSQFMPMIGRLFVNRFGNVRSMGVFWTARVIMAAPLLVVALFAGAGLTTVAVALLFIGVLGFNLARGAGMTGMQPVIGHLTTPQDHGLFMSRMQLIIHGVIVVTGLLMGLILDRESPLVVFTIIMAVGVVAGGIATFYVVRLPEPPRPERTAPLLRASPVQRSLRPDGAGAGDLVLERIRASTAYAALSDLPAPAQAEMELPQESFARAYARWIAWRSGDRRMRDRVDDALASTTQTRKLLEWGYEDFLPIAEAMDVLFEDMGWLTRT